MRINEVTTYFRNFPQISGIAKALLGGISVLLQYLGASLQLVALTLQVGPLLESTKNPRWQRVIKRGFFENPPFLYDLSIQTSIYRGFPNKQMFDDFRTYSFTDSDY